MITGVMVSSQNVYVFLIVYVCASVEPNFFCYTSEYSLQITGIVPSGAGGKSEAPVSAAYVIFIHIMLCLNLMVYFFLPLPRVTH